MDYSNEFSSDGSGRSESSLEDSGEGFNVVEDVKIIQPYMFEPVESDSSEEADSDESMVSQSSSNSGNASSRLQDTDW